MRIRHYVSSLSAILIVACAAYASESTVLYGAPMHDPNGKPCGEQGGKDGDGGIDNSDPIDLSTGGFIHRQTDLVIPGRGLDFEINRIYSSYGGLQSAVEGGWDPTDDNPNTNTIGNRDLIHVLTEGPLGDNWDFNYNMRVSFSEPVFDSYDGGQIPETPDPVFDPDEYIPASMDVMTGAGRIVPFFLYSATAGDVATTTPVHFSNEHYRWRASYTFAGAPVYIRDSSLTTYEFFGGWSSSHGVNGSSSSVAMFGGRLKSITDNNGNKIEFYWETSSSGQERIDYAIDTLGNQINFVYHNEIYNGQSSQNSNDTAFDNTVLERLIWKIIDHTDREYEYLYTNDLSFPVLTSVTSPKIVSNGDFPLPSEHERFPEGRTWSYTYDNSPALGGWWSGRMLTAITSPNGEVVTENEYDYLRNGDFENFDRNDSRVIRQRYGNAYYNYIVTDLNGSIDLPDLGVVDYDYYVWVNDRRGAITRFKYAGKDSLSGFHRQLLEKVEFLEFDLDADHQVWGVVDANGDVSSWRVRDTNSSDPNASTSYAELAAVDIDQEAIVRHWNTNTNWDVTLYSMPNGDTQSQDSWRAGSGTGPGQTTDDPLLWGAIESSTVTSQDGSESITEEWRYNFTLAGGGGGCGCGSNIFATAHKDGKGYVTLREFDPLTGNLLTVYHDMPIGTDMSIVPPASPSAAAAIDSYTYNQYGQVATHTHPSKTTLTTGGSEAVLERVDQFEYYDIPNQINYGRLHKRRVDVGGFNLITIYEYDAVGNVVKETSPDGDITLFLYNQNTELVQAQSFDASESTLFAQTDYFYDANGNIVREETLNLDGSQNSVALNPTITSVSEYDLHDYLLTMSREVGEFNSTINEVGGGDGTGRYIAPDTDDDFVTQKWEYDGAKNLTRFRDGENVNGIDLGDIRNYILYSYDARDLLIKKQVSAGASIPIVTDYVYDENERLVTTVVDSIGYTQTQSSELVYDAFNRITKRTDPMGNEVFFKYDDNHNPIGLRVCGPVNNDDEFGAESQATLAKVTRSYGPQDLMDQQAIKIFSYTYNGSSSTGPSCDDGLITQVQYLTEYEYNDDRSLRLSKIPAVNGTQYEETSLFYDTASRLEFLEDGAGSITQYEYDADSNITKMMQTDVASSGMGVEVFEATYEYDTLDRRVAVIDGVGNRSETIYDSRSNILVSKDARDNLNVYTYDSMNRLLSTSLGNGLVTAAKAYDASSRLISETDHNGNETAYKYDGLNRLIKITMPDGEFYEAEFDYNGNMSQYTDARGVVVSQLFDLNNRLIARTIDDSAVTGGIPGTQAEEFKYDGLGRLRYAENGFTEITREYDSRSNIIREIQNIDNQAGVYPVVSNRVVEYTHDLANNVSQIAYPSGRDVYRTYDQLNRLSGIFKDNAFNNPISEFDYIGRRLKSRINGNGTQTDYQYNGFTGAQPTTGDFGFGRMAQITTTNTSSGATLDDFAFTWDKTQNRISYKDLGSDMKNRRERIFGYDDANRLISTDVDYPDPLTDFPAPANNGITTYTLDGVYNRTGVTGFEGNGTPVGDYSQSGDQAFNNQCSLTPREAGGEWAHVYDENGNMIAKVQNSAADFNGDYTLDGFDALAFTAAFNSAEIDPDTGEYVADYNGDGVLNFFDISAFLQDFGVMDGVALEHWHYTYDFRNQLVDAIHKEGASLTLAITTNTYDAFARRVSERVVVSPDAQSPVIETRQFVYGCASTWEVLEQIDLENNGETLTTHVYGLGIDDEVSYRLEDLSIPEDIWAHRDDLNSLTSISDLNGNIVERYEYGDYGKVSIFDDAGLALSVSSYSVHHLYTGRPLIAGTGLYDYRFRVMEPETGGFNQRDPMGYVDSMNVYAYVSLSPHSLFDPYGKKAASKYTLWMSDNVYNGAGDPHNPEGIYITYTMVCTNECGDSISFTVTTKTKNTRKFIKNLGQQTSGGCKLSSFTVSAHHSATYGVWGLDDEKGRCNDSYFGENINMTDGGVVNLNVCNGKNLAEQIVNNNKDVDVKVNYTEGTNLYSDALGVDFTPDDRHRTIDSSLGGNESDE